jgi:transcriptional regulator with XRE-family HTH domain
MLKDRLQQAMDAGQGLTQAGLAGACGIRPPSVSDWVSGETKTIKGTNLLRGQRAALPFVGKLGVPIASRLRCA